MKNKKESITFDVYERESLCKDYLNDDSVEIQIDETTKKTRY